MEGNKTATLTVVSSATRDGYQYRCKVTDGEGNVNYSDSATLRVTTFKTQPASYIGSEGEMVSFTVEATGEGLTYQGQ